MPHLNEQQIDIQATLALSRLGADNDLDAYGTVQLMKDACDAIGKGDEGEHAVKELIHLWREREFGEITGDALSELCAIVERMDETSNKMKAICDTIDKGTSGARAVRALRDLWQELKLGEIDGDKFSTLFAVVDKMHGQVIKRFSLKAV